MGMASDGNDDDMFDWWKTKVKSMAVLLGKWDGGMRKDGCKVQWNCPLNVSADDGNNALKSKRRG